MIIKEKDYLEHYGVKGMKWYQHLFGKEQSHAKYAKSSVEAMGRKRLKNARTANMDKWGKDADHNICYIAGYSGSGKSTVSSSLADKNTDIIHLDAYTDKGAADKRNRQFDAYLKEKGVDPPKKYPRNEWPEKKVLEKFEQAVDDFGKAQFNKNRKVIAEGVQVANRTLWEDHSHYSDKPIVLLSTGIRESLYKSTVREIRRLDPNNKSSDIRLFLDAMATLENYKNNVQTYMNANSNLDSLQAATNAKRGEDWVKEYLKKTA